MNFGLMFAFQRPPGSPFTSAESYQDMLSCLPRAEELGYESAFCIEHHVQPDDLCPSPLLAMSAAAAVTERMRIGTGVLLVPLYAPAKLAEDVAVIDNISNGRFVFGVAPGYVTKEFELHGVPRKQRQRRFEEALDLMQLAWTGEPFSFDGDYYTIEPEAYVSPKPVQEPHPPIWYGVSGPQSLRNAARRGAVLITSPRHGLGELQEHYSIYEDEAAQVGYEITERPMMRELFIAETQEKAEELAAPAVDYLFTELYGKASAAGERELRADDGSLVEDKTAVEFAKFKARYIIGTPDHAIAEIERYRDALGITDMIGWTHLPGISGEAAMRSVELFAREVMPAFQD
jgi:alkanesulfonate monooxygenase SsuD/methylene tetrahydromethanopterin reductase-like flavin-dependent oxidoreductase (luciferase family)